MLQEFFTPGTRVQQRYVIQRTLGAGGFALGATGSGAWGTMLESSARLETGGPQAVIVGAFFVNDIMAACLAMIPTSK